MGDWNSSTDAAGIKPKLIPDGNLRPRDDSGGMGWTPHTGEWDDGGYVMGGAKAHLSAKGGETDIHEKRNIDGGNEEEVDHRGPHVHSSMSPLKGRKGRD